MSEPPQPLSPGERAILDAIGGLHRRLDGLEARLTTVETQAMGLAGLVADTADQHIGRLQAQGVDVDARLAAGLRLAERMTRPEFTALVEHLIDESTQQREKIEELTQAVKGIGGMVAVGVDAFDGFAATVAAKGSPLDDRLLGGLALAERLSRPEALRAAHALVDRLPALERLARSAALETETVDLLTEASAALVMARRENPPGVGFFGALSALSKPELQRALALVLRIGERIGRSLHS